MIKFDSFVLILSIFFFNFSYCAQEKQTKQKLLDKNLFDKAKNLDLDGVQELINQGANPDGYKDEFGYTALYAIDTYFFGFGKDFKNKIQTARNIATLLIKSGANVNVKDNQGTPLLFYSFLGPERLGSPGPSALKLYHILIENGANINIQNSSGKTILMNTLDILKKYHPADSFGDNIPEIVNIILFRTNFEYNLDLLDNEGKSIYEYLKKTSHYNIIWMIPSIKSFKLLKNTKISHINECLNKEILPVLSNLVQQYLGESGVTSTEQKEKEEVI